ncbi:Solute carrier family 22 member 18 [Geodia barretti]|uniref:Solute carrier family 22 member 18 n=2 Tax=Geodia barretti TaxID=519541 RepID=A0AA35QZL9_GEOBA|nr:Solute carrier family 22 member 18 [Geodia barretti]
MVMTDVSGAKDRADALGKLGVAYGVGMVVGPPVGGYVTVYFSEQSAAGVAAALCVVSMAIVVMFVPQSTKDPSHLSSSRDPYNSGGVVNVKAILSLLSIPAVAYVIGLKTVMGVPAGVFQAMFTVVNIERLELTPETNGQLLSYIGFVTMIMQGFVVGYIGRRVSDKTTLIGSVVIVALSYLVLMVTSTLFQLCLILIPMIMGGALLNTLTSSVITKVVPDTATGTSLGLSMATHSLIRTVSPTLGGYIYQWLGYPGFGALGFTTGSLMAAVLMLRGGIPGIN